MCHIPQKNIKEKMLTTTIIYFLIMQTTVEEDEKYQGVIVDVLPEVNYYVSCGYDNIITDTPYIRDKKKYTDSQYFYNLIPGITDTNRRYTLNFTALYKWNILNKVKFIQRDYRHHMREILIAVIKKYHNKKLEKEIMDTLLEDLDAHTISELFCEDSNMEKKVTPFFEFKPKVIDVPEKEEAPQKLVPIFELRDPRPSVKEAIKAPLPIAKRKISDRKKPFGNFGDSRAGSSVNDVLKPIVESKSKYVSTFVMREPLSENPLVIDRDEKNKII